jgi:cell shape-determining protein MreD
MALAFVGGVFVDLLGFKPLGTSVFALLIVVGLAAAASPLFVRIRLASPLLGVAALTPIFIVITTVTTGLLRPPAASFRLSNVAGAIIANLILTALLAPLFGAVRRRWDRRNRLVW